MANKGSVTQEASPKRAEDIDNIIIDIEVILQTVKQANLLFDAQAWDYLRQINDQVKAQAKRKPEPQAIFKQLIDYLARGPRAPKTPPPPPATK